MSLTFLRHRDGLWPNGLALGYGVLGYASGLMLLIVHSPIANVFGVLLLAHAMVICAYLIHECAHNTLFANNVNNARFGAFLSWFTGSSYARYEDLRRKHFRHHVERADVIRFDYRRGLTQYPLAIKLIAALEWAYIPAVEVMLHLLVIVLPFTDDHYRPNRTRVLVVLLIRASLFILLGLASIKALVLYGVSYMFFLTVLRFMDANQHTYELVETHDESPVAGLAQRDREYEYRNTYSNLISVRYPLLNLFTLNFAYHNAHHDRPTVPWYRLPAQHKALYGDDAAHILYFGVLLRAYHRHRVARAFRPNVEELGKHAGQGPDLMGIDGISFLIPV